MQFLDTGTADGLAIGHRHEQIRSTFLQLRLHLHDLVQLDIVLLANSARVLSPRKAAIATLALKIAA